MRHGNKDYARFKIGDAVEQKGKISIKYLIYIIILLVGILLVLIYSTLFAPFKGQISSGSIESWETYYYGSVTSNDKSISIPELVDLSFAANETWRVTFEGAEYICESKHYDDDLYYIGNLNLSTTDDGTGEPFLLYNMSGFGSTSKMVGNIRTDGTSTIKLEKQVGGGSSNTGKDSSNPLRGKIVAFTGDSICAGAGFPGGYAKIIGLENDMIVENIGVSDGTVVKWQDKFCISESIAEMRSDAEYVILEGGGNDAWWGNQNIPLGTITDGYTDTLDTTTFAGAFETMLKSAIEKYPTAKIGYIFVHKCIKNFDSRTTESYYNVAKAACEKWGIPYCDLNTQTPPLGYIDALKTAYTLNGDGIHPNEQGYKLFYVPKIVAWMKTL